MQIIFYTILASISVLVFFLGLKNSQKGNFYNETFLLNPLGIFVWGDALILGPFWLVSSFIFIFICPLNVLRYYLLFWAIRSFFEVIYWLNHQAVKDDYNPPMFRKIKWLKANESAILYQLMNSCQFILALFLIYLTFSWAK
jgi:hypothetical protein